MNNLCRNKKNTFPLLPSYLRSHNFNFRFPKHVSLQAWERPASEVGARNVVPGSSAVASNSTCKNITIESANYTSCNINHQHKKNVIGNKYLPNNCHCLQT